MNPFKVVEGFEKAVANFTDAPYVVAVNSCTNALFLCLEWQKYKKNNPDWIEIPKRTYIGVAQSIKNAGYDVRFRDQNWRGHYKLNPYPIFDSAKEFYQSMFQGYFSDYDQIETELTYVCTSHHWTKILGIQQGGCILHNDKLADEWFRKARFDGRTAGKKPSEDLNPIRGWHMYMSPEVAAEGLVRLHHLPLDGPEYQPTDNYPDLSQMEIFK
jgi:dTDP-4-amino-4,6-dideoxygalactose transaminase